MSDIFSYSGFNGNISNWDVSNVTTIFNQPLNFDTSNVTNMKWMFAYTKKINQPLNFDTSNVTDMNGMFYQTEKFNQPFRMNNLNIKDQHGKELDDFFSKISNKEFSKEI